ncbi:hypothetical protein [Sphingosinithalassobacter portus]|uniref:hypothetical protein n=1 Tax=Stakelama portus TaxID=2676234 RepID=UPI0011AB4422|nr:hypothetical protein [Sphingosinithalassobacter portus]
MANGAQTEMFPSRRMPKWAFGLVSVAAGLGVVSSGYRADNLTLIVMGCALALISLIVTVLLLLKR